MFVIILWIAIIVIVGVNMAPAIATCLFCSLVIWIIYEFSMMVYREHILPKRDYWGEQNTTVLEGEDLEDDPF
jgi:hypothetical protein